MIAFPNAKINLGLNIVGKRDDGYHLLETLFLPISLSDFLEITFSSSVDDQFFFHGLKIDTDLQYNSIYKTIHFLRKKGFSIPPLRIDFIKKIPFGAGLGGGSSDATFTLRLLNDLCHLSLSLDDMERLIGKVGADCPFFVKNTPSIGKGIGDQLKPFKEIEWEKYVITIVKPPFGINTKEAFEGITVNAEHEGELEKVLTKSIDEWKKYIWNDFEKTLFPKYPVLSNIKDSLYSLGALYASMSGSGSTLYAISEEELSIPHDQYPYKNCFIWQGVVLSNQH